MSKKNLNRFSIAFDLMTREGVIATYMLGKCKSRKKASFIARCIYEYAKNKGVMDVEKIDVDALMEAYERELEFNQALGEDTSASLKKIGSAPKAKPKKVANEDEEVLSDSDFFDDEETYDNEEFEDTEENTEEENQIMRKNLDSLMGEWI